MAGFFRDNVTALAAYVPGEQPRGTGVIKLNANENPYPPSPKVLRAVRGPPTSRCGSIPEPASDSLRAVASRVYGLGVDHIIAGNGSDELLTILMRCFVGHGTRRLSDADVLPVRHPGRHPGRRSRTGALSGGFLDSSIAGGPAGGPHVSLSSQRAIGTLVRRAQIARLAKAVRGILVVDKAYIDFASQEDVSAIPLIRRLPNLVVLRTFSKSFSLAGLRIGLAFASPAIVGGMMKVKDSYNLNRVSAAAAARRCGT